MLTNNIDGNESHIFPTLGSTRSSPGKIVNVVYTALAAGTYTTTSTAVPPTTVLLSQTVNVDPAASGSFTIGEGKSATLIVEATFNMVNNSADIEQYCALTYDGVLVAGSSRMCKKSRAAESRSVFQLNTVITNVTSGDHTVAIVWSCSAGTSTCTQNTAQGGSIRTTVVAWGSLSGGGSDLATYTGLAGDDAKQRTNFSGGIKKTHYMYGIAPDDSPGPILVPSGSFTIASYDINIETETSKVLIDLTLNIKQNGTAIGAAQNLLLFINDVSFVGRLTLGAFSVSNAWRTNQINYYTTTLTRGKNTISLRAASNTVGLNSTVRPTTTRPFSYNSITSEGFIMRITELS